MEEQTTTPQPQQPKVEKKGKKKIVVDEAKIKEAKKKVNDLLSGTGLEDPVVFVPPTEEVVNNPLINNDSGSAWLSDQVAALSSQVEMHEATIAQLKSDNAKLLAALSGGGGSANIGDLSASEKQKIIELYKYFEGIYTGRNQMRAAFDTAKFSNPSHGTGILDMFLSTFVFLNEHKQYQHRAVPQG